MWGVIAESGIPVMFHVDAYLEYSGYGATGATSSRTLGLYRPLWSLLAFTGIVERHTYLKVVVCEGGIGWVLWTLQDADRVFHSYGAGLKLKLKELPSFYFRRQCYASFLHDDVGLKVARNYDMTGNILWSSHYPHGESIFSDPRGKIRKICDTFGNEQATKIVGGHGRAPLEPARAAR